MGRHSYLAVRRKESDWKKIRLLLAVLEALLSEQTSITLSKITKVDLRDCWQNEVTDFTPWLATEENMSLLADALEMIM